MEKTDIVQLVQPRMIRTLQSDLRNIGYEGFGEEGVRKKQGMLFVYQREIDDTFVAIYEPDFSSIARREGYGTTQDVRELSLITGPNNLERYKDLEEIIGIIEESGWTKRISGEVLGRYISLGIIGVTLLTCVAGSAYILHVTGEDQNKLSELILTYAPKIAVLGISTIIGSYVGKFVGDRIGRWCDNRRTEGLSDHATHYLYGEDAEQALLIEVKVKLNYKTLTGKDDYLELITPKKLEEIRAANMELF